MGGLASLLGATEGKRGDKPCPDDDPDKPQKKAPAPKEEEDAEPVTAAKTDAPTDPAQEWLAPIKEKFLEARKNGASMAELQRMIITLHPRTKPLRKRSQRTYSPGSGVRRRKKASRLQMPERMNQKISKQRISGDAT